MGRKRKSPSSTKNVNNGLDLIFEKQGFSLALRVKIKNKKKIP
jgi:hypothetical protein